MSEATLREGLLGLVRQLRDIGDALRTTNLIRGREIHQLADDFDRLLEALPAAHPEKGGGTP
jgi:hypothetical protein